MKVQQKSVTPLFPNLFLPPPSCSPCPYVFSIITLASPLMLTSPPTHPSLTLLSSSVKSQRLSLPRQVIHGYIKIVLVNGPNQYSTSAYHGVHLLELYHNHAHLIRPPPRLLLSSLPSIQCNSPRKP
ncbi:hypothetical protein AMTRI_Chr05g73340 [Amborella trichopoda]